MRERHGCSLGGIERREESTVQGRSARAARPSSGGGPLYSSGVVYALVRPPSIMNVDAVT
jgi:hypothetical protein